MQKFLASHWTLILGLIFIFLGLLLLLAFGPTDLLHKLAIGFITEVGFALLIAWAVALLVERGARREYDHYTQEKGRIISQNVFGYLYNVKFPRSVFSTIEEHVFKAQVIKIQQRLDYELLDPTDDTGWIKMRCEFDYTLKNISDEAIDYPIRFHASQASGTRPPSYSDVDLQTLVVGGVTMPPERFGAIDRASPDDVGEKRYEVVKRLEPDEETRVRVTFVQVKRVEDNDLWTSNSVCRNLELKFRYNPNVFAAFVSPVHPAGKFDTDIKPSGGNNCRTVTIDKALLPKNGVFMWWNRVPNPAPSIPSDAQQSPNIAPPATNRT